MISEFSRESMILKKGSDDPFSGVTISKRIGCFRHGSVGNRIVQELAGQRVAGGPDSPEEPLAPLGPCWSGASQGQAE